MLFAFVLVCATPLAFGNPVALCDQGIARATDMVSGNDLTGQVYIITGADHGLGYAASLALASANATVVMGNRGTTGKYAKALADIKSQTGNQNVFNYYVDLTEFALVEKFASKVIKDFPKIKAVICNAAIMDTTHFVTKDGFEAQIQVALLSHWLLVERLTPVLKYSKGRVIVANSFQHFFPCINDMPSDCTDISYFPKTASTTKAGLYYGYIKYYQLFIAAEYARRNPDVLTLNVMPGVSGDVSGDETLRIFGFPFDTFCGQWAVMGGPSHCPGNYSNGAASNVWAASTDPSNVEQYNGEYLSTCHVNGSRRTAMIEDQGLEFTLDFQAKAYDAMLTLIPASRRAQDEIVFM